MPAQRQQRTSRVRSTLGLYQQNTRETIPLQYPALGVDYADFVGVTIDPLATVSFATWSLTGIPPITIGGPSTYPINAQIIGDALRLTYSGPLGPEPSFFVRANMPQIRGPQGQYIASGILEAPAEPPSPVDTIISRVVWNGSVLYAQLSPGTPEPGMKNITAIVDDTYANPVNYIAVATGNIYFTLAGPMGPTMQISFLGGDTNWINATGGSLQAGTFIVETP